MLAPFLDTMVVATNADCAEIGAVGMKSFDGTARILIESDMRCVVIDAADRPPFLCVSRPGIRESGGGIVGERQTKPNARGLHNQLNRGVTGSRPV